MELLIGSFFATVIGCLFGYSVARKKYEEAVKGVYTEGYLKGMADEKALAARGITTRVRE